MNYRTLTSTFSLLTKKSFNKIFIPIQNNEVYPFFDQQANLRIELKGTWKKQRVKDPKLSIRIRDEATIQKLRNEIKGITLPKFDDFGLFDHELPGVENKIGRKILAHGKGMETYEGGVWYRKVITIHKETDKVYLFKALAMSYISDVFINDVYLGTHEGSFNAFSYDVTKALIQGDNVFAIRVHNIPWGSRADVIPAVEGTDYFNYTGIIHDFWIDVLPEVSIRRVDLIPLSLEKTEVTIIVRNKSNHEVQLPMSFDLCSTKINLKNLGSSSASDLCDKKIKTLADQSLVIGADSIEVLRFTIDTYDLKPWGLLDPSLYVLKTTTPFEVLHHEFGIRTLTTSTQSIILNGKPVFLNGMARHEENMHRGRSLTHQEIGEECLRLKDLNVNFTRTAHYPNHPLTYRILDRLGIAAMMEVPLWQHEDVHFKTQIKRKIDIQMWREMIFSQRNRPSVFLWSTQNECNGNQYRLAYNRLLVNDLKNNFPDGRLTTQSAAADRPGYADPSMRVLDVLGYTLYFGVFHGQEHDTDNPHLDQAYLGTRAFLENAHRFHKKPVLVSEYGIWSSTGEQFQIDLTLNNLRAFIELRNLDFSNHETTYGFVSGINYWTINDWFCNHNLWIQSMGFKTLDRSPKPIENRLKPLYKRLISASFEPQKDQNLFKGHLFINGPKTVLYVNKNGFDASKMPYLVIRGDDPMFEDGFDIMITHKNGENRILSVEKCEEIMVFHLWTLEPDFLKQMVALTLLSTSDERRLHIRQIDCCTTLKKR